DLAARGLARLAGRGLRLRKPNVDDDGVPRIAGIDFGVSNAGDFFVLTDARPRVPAERNRRGAHLDADDTGIRACACQYACRKRACDAQAQRTTFWWSRFTR